MDDVRDESVLKTGWLSKKERRTGMSVCYFFYLLFSVYLCSQQLTYPCSRVGNAGGLF